jgi:parvulin-like peptidyl-prolyl isomerase
VTKGSFRVKAVAAAAFGLQAGQLAPLVETDDAWYVAKVKEREEGRVVPFTEAQDEIEDELRDKQFNETVAKHIQDLYQRAYVRLMPDNL